jgi:hypothetical protein
MSARYAHNCCSLKTSAVPVNPSDLSVAPLPIHDRGARHHIRLRQLK